MSRYYKLLLALILILLEVSLSSCSTNEEKAILSRLESLKEKSEVREKQNKLELLAQSKEIEKYFCSSLEINLLEGPYSSKTYSLNEIRNSFIKFKSLLGSLELSIQNPKISLKGKSATASFQASALGKMPKEEGKFFELHEVRLELEKINGKWRICKGEQIENLRE